MSEKKPTYIPYADLEKRRKHDPKKEMVYVEVKKKKSGKYEASSRKVVDVETDL